MTQYPYNCFEQRLSRIVSLGDAGGWTRLAGEMPTYQAPDGLLRYFPSARLDGSEALTAYVLSLTSEAGLAIPDGPRAKMVDALKAVLDGRVRHEDYGDVRLRRVAALAALARAGAATPAMLGQIGMTPAEMPTATLADYLAALDHVGAANAQALRAQAEAVLRTRLVFEGTRLDLSDSADQPWWMMSSGDEAAIRALLAILGRPGWQDDGPRMMVGVAFRQARGHWDTTTANAWGTLAAKRFERLYPAQAIAGVTTASLGTRTISRAWPLAAAARAISLPLPAASTPLVLRQVGGAGPWATVSVRAAVPLVDRLAPEHLEIVAREADALAGAIRNAGAIFLGHDTPEAIGDYVGGSNHVLPTARSARFASGLGVLDFMKRTSILKCSPAALATLGPAAIALGEAEGLAAHARSVALRMTKTG